MLEQSVGKSTQFCTSRNNLVLNLIQAMQIWGADWLAVAGWPPVTAWLAGWLAGRAWLAGQLPGCGWIKKA